MGVARHLGRTVGNCFNAPIDRRHQPVHQSIPQRVNPTADISAHGFCRYRRLRHSDDSGNVLGSAAALALLPATMHEGRQGDSFAHIQCANTLRAPKLVTGNRHKVGRRGDRTKVHPRQCLHRVHQEKRCGDELTHHRRQLSDRLDRTDFVIHRHDGDDQRRPMGTGAHDGAARRVEIENPFRTDGQRLVHGLTSQRHPVRRFTNSVVLNRTGEKYRLTVRRCDAPQRQVDRLRPSPGKHDLARLPTEDRRHCVTGRFQRFTGIAGDVVDARRIPKPPAQNGHHGVDGGGVHGCCSCMVEIVHGH